MSSRKKSKDFLSFLFRLALSLTLLIWLFSKIDIKKTVEVLKSSDINFIMWGGIVFFSIYFILLTRWVVFIKALGLHVSSWNVLRYFFIGLFGNLFLPSAIGGDLIKIYGLCKDTSEKPKVVASVLLDRLSGYAGLVIVASTTFIFGYRGISDLSILGLILILAVGWTGVMAVLLNERLYSLCCCLFSRWPKVKDRIMEMHYDIAMLDHKAKAFSQTIGLSVITQITYAFVFFLLAKAMHQDVPMIYFFIFVPLISVAAAFPSIGGLGVREAGVVHLFKKVGVDPGISLSISLINFLFMVMVGLLGGLIFLTTKSSLVEGQTAPPLETVVSPRTNTDVS